MTEYRTCIKCGEVWSTKIFWHPTICCIVPSIWVNYGIAMNGYWYGQTESELCQETIHEFTQHVDEDIVADIMRIKSVCLDELKLKLKLKFEA